MNFRLWSLVAMVTAGISWGVSAHAQTLADLRADYDSPLTAHAQGETSAGKIDDTAGTGFWDFYSSATVDPTDESANLTALVFVTTSNFARAGNAYVQPLTTLDLPAWSNANLITPSETEGAPDSNELAVHPGNSGQSFAVAIWTSGYTGLVNLGGSIRDMGVFADGVTLDIFHNGASVFVSGATSGNTAINFDETFLVNETDSVFFVIGLNGVFDGDQSALSATITAVPETASYAILAGLAACGFVAVRRRRR